MITADVYKAGVLAAALTKSGSGVEFRYRDDYLAADGPPIATTLPRGTEPTLTVAGAVPPFFAGLLPEGRRLTSLRLAIKASADDELSLLLAVGRDTIGDVKVVPAGEPLDRAAASDDADLPDLASVRFADYVGARARVDFSGLAGVQDKVSGRMFAMPVSFGGRECILKLTPPEFPYMVENEAFFLELSRACGIPTVAARVVHDREGAAGLLVTRFDFEPADGAARYRSVEDGCQALGLWPADKYNTSMETLIGALADLCRARPVALRDAFRQFVFSIVTGNGDLHAKNMSITRVGDAWRIAPAYDLPSTVFYGDATTALPALGKRHGFSRRRLLEFADAIGLARAAAERVVDTVLAGTAMLIEDIGSGALPFDQKHLHDAAREFTYRRGLLG